MRYRLTQDPERHSFWLSGEGNWTSVIYTDGHDRCKESPQPSPGSTDAQWQSLIRIYRLQAQVFNPELFYFPTGSSENQPSVETIFPWKCLVFPAKVLRKGDKGFSAEAEDLYKM